MTELTMARALQALDRAVILTHRRPDGDTVGCAAALCLGLRALGKRAVILENPELTDKYTPYFEGLTCGAIDPDDTIIAVDVAAEDMYSRGLTLPRPIDLAIDHHASNSGYAKTSLVRPERAACGEIVLQVITALCGELTKEEADLLYIALSTDCGCFQYANTDAHALLSAAALVTAGADNARLNQLFFRKVSIPRIKLEGLIYANMSFHRDGKVVVAIVTDEMIAEAGATEDDCDDLAGLAGRAECGEVSITIRDYPGGHSKVSVRSGESFDSCALCARFGGGGHKMAAGCNLPVPPLQARELLLQAIDEVWA